MIELAFLEPFAPRDPPSCRRAAQILAEQTLVRTSGELFLYLFKNIKSIVV